MPRRSQRLEQTSVRSTASRFANVQGNEQVTPEEVQEQPPMTDEELKQAQANHPLGLTGLFEPHDDPFKSPFPLNYIYLTQDFLNDELDVGKFIQLLVLVYLLQVFYITGGDKLWSQIETIGINYLGVLVGTIYTYILRWRRYQRGLPEKPKLPEFNLIHAVLIPNLICIKYDMNVIENLSFNYFVIENLPIAARTMSAIMYYFLMGDDNASLQTYLPKVIVFVALNYLIEYVNTGDEEHLISKEVVDQEIDYDLVTVNSNKVKSGFNASLSKADIQLFVVLITNTLFNVPTDDINLLIFQKLLISLIVGLVLNYPVFLFNKNLSIITFCPIFYGFTTYQLSPILSSNPIVWIIDEIKDNQTLFGIWMSYLLISIVLVFNLNFEFNFRRKVWHFLSLGIVFPSLLINKDFTILGLLGSIILIILLEIVRVNKLTIIGEIIHDKLYKFQDFKDLKGPLNLSYIYLILGITFPIILEHNLKKQNTVKQYIGLISLGVGDSFASIVGKKFGNIHYKGLHKTVEGSIAFFICNVIGFKTLADYFKLPPLNYEVVGIANLLAGVFEGVITMNDNILIPIMLYILWDVLELTVQLN